MLLRSLQDISQSYIKCTENTSLTYDDDDSNSSIIVIVIIIDDSNNGFKNEEKVQL